MEHLTQAALLPNSTASALRQLVDQLDGLAVLPVVGAGGSYDCGGKLATRLAEQLYGHYLSDSSYEPRASDHTSWKADLGVVSDAMALDLGQRDVLRRLGFEDRRGWPDAAGIEDHFCAYRVLARLAREDLFTEAISFNYDCGFEAGLLQEGFVLRPVGFPGRYWLDHATVVSDRRTNAQLQRRGAFALTKAHGCVARYRDGLASGEDHIEESIILRWSQLLDWRGDFWARDVLADRARHHVLLLLGFSGEDPVIHTSLARILSEVYEASGSGPAPRVVVLDPEPHKLRLRMLKQAGTGGPLPSGPGPITAVPTGRARLTALLLVLLVEFLEQRLARVLGRSPVFGTDPHARLLSAVVTGPAMLRWTFTLRRDATAAAYVHRINLTEAASRGYVPLTPVPDDLARALDLRHRLRNALGLPPTEDVSQTVSDAGFLSPSLSGRAYLPVSMTADDLRTVLRDPNLRRDLDALPAPRFVERILVGEDAGGLVGVSADTGHVAQTW